jgi:transposase
MVAASARVAIGFSLSGGNAHDAPEGQILLQHLGAPSQPLKLIMDKAYEGNTMRQLALDLGYEPVVPPKSNRLNPWGYDRQIYARRNEIERLFRRFCESPFLQAADKSFEVMRFFIVGHLRLT